MSAEAAVFATRYVAAVGVGVLLYDHLLTLAEEIDLMWLNPAAGLGYRIIFFVDRYLTEAVSLYTAYSKSFLVGLSLILTHVPSDHCQKFFWILALTTTIFTTLSNFVLAIRVYTLWDGRRAIKWLLICSFGAALPVSLVFTIFSAQELQSSVAYNPLIRMCVVLEKPSALPVVLGVWVAFDFFIIILTIYNALEKPHQTQAEIMTTLQHDGAKMFLVSETTSSLSLQKFKQSLSAYYAILRLANLIVAIVGDAAYCLATFTILWAMCSVVTSRMQLRVERLRFTRFGGDLLPTNFLHM
ncbi:hypothetical protein FB451DRAFT_1386814 [Mycena latifolia]|nr:hypothetical protein FB451DRAFT_1386814 [Mycena latifolia]